MQTRSMQTREAKKWVDRAIIAVLLLMGILMLMPFFWLFSMSFRPAADAYRMPPSFFPPSFDLTNYRTVLESSVPFLKICGLTIGGWLMARAAAVAAQKLAAGNDREFTRARSRPRISTRHRCCRKRWHSSR